MVCPCCRHSQNSHKSVALCILDAIKKIYAMNIIDLQEAAKHLLCVFWGSCVGKTNKGTVHCSPCRPLYLKIKVFVHVIASTIQKHYKKKLMKPLEDHRLQHPPLPPIFYSQCFTSRVTTSIPFLVMSKWRACLLMRNREGRVQYNDQFLVCY